MVINDLPVHGLMHPEGGHLCVPRRAADAGFEGPNPTDCFGAPCRPEHTARLVEPNTACSI